MAEVLTFGSEPDPIRRIRLKQGARLRQYRNTKGMTLDDLAEAIEVTPGAIRHWEEGRHSPKIGHQLALAQVLDVPHSILFDAEVA